MLIPPHRQTGFSLLEMVIALALIAILIHTSLSQLNQSRQLQKYKTTQQQLADIKQTLLSYIHTNHFLPCPDTSNNGYENRKADGSCQANRGRLPYLEFGGIGMQDEFGQPFLYVTHQHTTNNNTMRNTCLSASLFAKSGQASHTFFERTADKTRHCTLNQCEKDKDGNNNISCTVLNAATRDQPPYFSHLTQPLGTTTALNGALRVCSPTAPSCVSNTALSNISGNHLPVVVVSFGQNSAATWQNCANSSSREQENCDNDVYFQQDLLNPQSSGQLFDDQIIWLTMHEIKAQMRTQMHWVD